jgi:hypothetical protein
MDKLEIRKGMKFIMLSKTLVDFLGPDDIFDFSGKDEFTNKMIKIFQSHTSLSDEEINLISEEDLTNDLMGFFFDNEAYYKLEITDIVEGTEDDFIFSFEYTNVYGHDNPKIGELMINADDVREFIRNKVMIYNEPKFFFIRDNKLCAVAPTDLNGEYIELFRNEKNTFEFEETKYRLKDFYRDNVVKK